MTGAADTVADEVDRRFMRLALALGERHLGLTWPNPSVGALVVAGPPDAPRIVAQGITQAGGRPHAERVALEAAGEQARGATLYVSLEPCSHQGLTPPCADAVIDSRIARVVTAMADPDPRVAGRGHARLEAAGIEVTTGVMEAEARRAHEGHIARITLGRPAITIKLARTADGFAAAGGPARLLITGEAANAQVHRLRVHADAILVGVDTVIADDPQLTVRLPGLESRSPLRVVLDSRLRLPPESRLAATAMGVPTLVLTTRDAPEAPERALAAKGVEVIRAVADGAGRVDLAAALRQLAARGITRLLCEGGPTLADALARERLVDRVVILTGADAIGSGLPAIGPNLARLIEGVAPERIAFGRDGAAIYEIGAEACSPAS